MPKNRTPPDRAAPAPRRPTSWAARYGQAILRDGIAALPRALYYHQGALGLAAHEVWFVSAILACKWDAGLPRPRLPVLAAQAGLSVRQLQKTRKELEGRGLLQVAACYEADGRQNANTYDFEGLFARLEELIAAHPADADSIRVDLPPEPADDEDPDTSFVARYGRVIARAGIAAIPQALFTYQAALDLSPQQVWFVSYILAHRWSADIPYPSLRRMVVRTGYSERQLHTIKQELVDRGYLRVITRYGAGGGQDTNGYDFSPLLDAITAHLQATAAPERVNSTTGAGANPSAVEGANSTSGEGVNLTSGERVNFTSRARVNSSSVGRANSITEGRVNSPSEGRVNSTAVARVTSTSGRRANSATAGGELAGRAEDEANRRGEGVLRFRRKEPDHEESDQKDSKVAPARQQDGSTPGPWAQSAYIAAVILDYSRELGDSQHDAANVSQALHLWQGSGLGETEFVELLHQARRQVRLYQGKQGLGQIGNKMAYFFTVVRDLVPAPPRADHGPAATP